MYFTNLPRFTAGRDYEYFINSQGIMINMKRTPPTKN